MCLAFLALFKADDEEGLGAHPVGRSVVGHRPLIDHFFMAIEDHRRRVDAVFGGGDLIDPQRFQVLGDHRGVQRLAIVFIRGHGESDHAFATQAFGLEAAVLAAFDVDPQQAIHRFGQLDRIDDDERADVGGVAGEGFEERCLGMLAVEVVLASELHLRRAGANGRDLTSRARM